MLQQPENRTTSKSGGPERRRRIVEKNPFTVPLATDQAQVAPTVMRGSRPHRLEVAARSCARPARVLLLANLAWGAALLGIVAVLWLEELGQPVAGAGPVVDAMAQISPYHVPWIGLAFLHVVAVCVGLMHVFTLQSYTLARVGVLAACLPLLGPWLGLTAPLGLLLLGRLRRRAVRRAFLG